MGIFKRGDVILWDNRVTFKIKDIITSYPIFNYYQLKVIDSKNDPYLIPGTILEYTTIMIDSMSEIIDVNYKQLDNIELNKPTDDTPKHGCCCGGYKAGYIKPSRSHSIWCGMYKE